MNKQDLLKLIDAYWKFDDNQQPMSSWHDKQDLLKRLDADLDMVINDELRNFINFHNESHPEKYIPNSELGNYLNKKP